MHWPGVVTLLVAFFSLVTIVASANPEPSKEEKAKQIWDHTPDFEKDKFPPYPELKIKRGDVNVEGFRGTRLFRYTDCTEKEKNIIDQAYDDFYKLAQQDALWNNLDMNDQGTKEFFGPNNNQFKIPDDTAREIKRIYGSAQQVYNNPWRWYPTWPPWGNIYYTWIEVKCSGKNGDPSNKCGDQKEPPPKCQGEGGEGTNEPAMEPLEAYSEPQGTWSTIVFCNKFFNDLPSLDEAMDRTKKQTKGVQDNLEYWNNRARLFFHEVTHQDYFMNADDTKENPWSPEVFDARIMWREGKNVVTDDVYGPMLCKILRNYIPTSKKDIGYYTQRNADSFAWLALAKYVQAAIGRYPPNPAVGNLKPTKKPVKASPRGAPLLTAEGSDDEGVTDPNALIGGNENLDHAPGFKIPGCGDRYDKVDMGRTTAQPQPEPEAGRWHYPYGDASKGQFAFYMIPGRNAKLKAKRSHPINKRLAEAAHPTVPSADAVFETWTQDGANSKHFGPFKINCQKPTDEWQGFDPKDTGLKSWLSIKGGHACTLINEDYNFDGVGIKYGSVADMAVNSDKACFKAGDKAGVSCVLDL